MLQKQLLVAKMFIALAVALVVGYAVGVSTAQDAERGRSLTLKAYIADFERHKANLESSDMPMAAAVVAGVIMVVGTFGLYELLAFGLVKGYHAVRGRASGSLAAPGGSRPG